MRHKTPGLFRFLWSVVGVQTTTDLDETGDTTDPRTFPDPRPESHRPDRNDEVLVPKLEEGPGARTQDVLLPIVVDGAPTPLPANWGRLSSSVLRFRYVPFVPLPSFPPSTSTTDVRVVLKRSSDSVGLRPTRTPRVPNRTEDDPNTHLVPSTAGSSTFSVLGPRADYLHVTKSGIQLHEAVSEPCRYVTRVGEATSGTTICH